MKVCFVITSLSRKGPIIVVQDLINNYIKSGIEVDLIYFDDIIEICLPKKVKLIQVKFFSRFDFSCYDIVHTHLLRGDLYGALNKRTIHKLISTCHSDFIYDINISHGKIIGMIIGTIWKIAYRYFDKLVFLTKINMQRYSDLADSTVIYNGRPAPNPDKNINTKYLDKICGKIVIGSCAYITKRKSLEHILECAKIRNAPNEIYVIVGDGPNKENLLNKALELGINEQCIFIPFTENVYNYISTFDLFCMTSSSEGMPLSLIEAASMKCPIVSSDISVIKEMFDDQEIIFYDYGNIYNLNKSITKALKMKLDLSQKVYSKYLNSYTDTEMSNQYIKLYKKLVNNVQK